MVCRTYGHGHKRWSSHKGANGKATRKLPFDFRVHQRVLHGAKPANFCPTYLRHHPAQEVYVTGTFDDWAKSVKLENKGEHFEKLVELPLSKEKIFYKVRYLRAPPFLYYEVWPIYRAQMELFQGNRFHIITTQKSGGCANSFRCLISSVKSAQGLRSPLGDKATLLTSTISSSFRIGLK